MPTWMSTLLALTPGLWQSIQRESEAVTALTGRLHPEGSLKSDNSAQQHQRFSDAHLEVHFADTDARPVAEHPEGG